MRHPTALVSLLGIALVLTLIGPFETQELMRLLPRFGYWLTLVVLCYSAGFFSHALVEARFGATLRRSAAAVLAAILTAAAVLGIVYLLNGLSLGFWAKGAELWAIAINTIVISFVVTIVLSVASATSQPPDKPGQPPILDRLPFDKRAQLVAISVEDHYVRVRTIKGEELILMRLGDAIKEVGATRGLQVHRSHWVALDQVRATRRKGDGAILTMEHGPDIPVSRSKMPAIRGAGLLGG